MGIGLRIASSSTRQSNNQGKCLGGLVYRFIGYKKQKNASITFVFPPLCHLPFVFSGISAHQKQKIRRAAEHRSSSSSSKIYSNI